MIKLFTLYCILYIEFSYGCIERKTKYGRVCVCNSTYCDTVPEIDVKSGKYQQISSSSAKLGFSATEGTFQPESNTISDHSITINHKTRYQTIFGFGGAFTDSTGINIASLPEPAQENLLNSYFGKNGLQYSVCRVPVGGTDFSTRPFSYDDVAGDANLKYFTLQKEDKLYKVPFIQKALNLTDNRLRLFMTAWTAPPWMKTNNGWAGIGFLMKKYYQVWTNYFVKFLEAYEKEGIDFWGMTTQNEPIDGYLPAFISDLNAMAWTPSQMNNWVGNYLGPTIRSSKFKDLKIMLHDDNRLTLPFLPLLLRNNKTMEYADGVAVHWYGDSMPASLLELAKTKKKDWFILASEASNGFLHFMGIQKSVELGSWNRADLYIKDIIQDFEHGVVGWVDWNMALNQQGGPTYIKNFIDSPIIVNNSTGEFYKQPMFYALGHFSKFIVPGSVRVEINIRPTSRNLKTLAFIRPDNVTAIIILNRYGQKSIQLNTTNGLADIMLEEKSINSILYK